MTTFALYGHPSMPIEAARIQIEKALGLAFTEHEGLYFGIYYLAQPSNGENFSLKFNLCPMDEEPLEQEFEDYKTLFYVTTQDVWDDARSSMILGINGFKLLSTTNG